MSRKIKITPWMELTADVQLINDRNASTALVHLYDNDSGEVIGHATGASKREQGDQYSEPVAVKLAVGRALQKMSRQMISEANKEVRAAMAEAEAKEAEEWAKAYDDEDRAAWDEATAIIDELKRDLGIPSQENKTADGTPVSDLPESMRLTLAQLGLHPHEVQIIRLDDVT